MASDCSIVFEAQRLACQLLELKSVIERNNHGTWLKQLESEIQCLRNSILHWEEKQLLLEETLLQILDHVKSFAHFREDENFEKQAKPTAIDSQEVEPTSSRHAAQEATNSDGLKKGNNNTEKKKKKSVEKSKVNRGDSVEGSNQKEKCTKSDFQAEKSEKPGDKLWEELLEVQLKQTENEDQPHLSTLSEVPNYSSSPDLPKKSTDKKGKQPPETGHTPKNQSPENNPQKSKDSGTKRNQKGTGFRDENTVYVNSNSKGLECSVGKTCSIPTHRDDQKSVQRDKVDPLLPKKRTRNKNKKRKRRPSSHFTMEEIERLVQAVEKVGIGRWKDIKRQWFVNKDNRTPSDLKDKWRTLKRAAEDANRKQKCVKVQRSLLERVLKADRVIEGN